VPAGPLTVADCWKIIPYENRLVTAEVTAAGLMAILAEDAVIKDSDRTLWPLDVVRDDTGRPLQILLDGKELQPDRRLKLGLNAYDAQSGGRRLMQTREMLAAPPAKLRISTIDTRTALIDGLLDRGTIG
jgi:2',3'-cyclic-nucleotide 2'-phosphodiesterase (5'-nucleotidase family)